MWAWFLLGVLVGAALGALVTLWWIIRGDVRSGDQAIPPYDDEEGWR